MIIIRTLDGQVEEIGTENIRELVPYTGLLASPLVRTPYAALIHYRDSILPVFGPLPTVWDTSAAYDHRPWILVCTDHARVIQGLPEFVIEEAEELADSESA